MNLARSMVFPYTRSMASKLKVGMSTAPSGFNPSDYGTLAIDLNPALGVWQDAAGTVAATANNDPVRLIQDQSGQNKHATGASDAVRPLLKLNAINSNLPSLSFDGSDDFLNGIDLSALTGAEMFLVIKRANEADQGGYGAFTGAGTATHYPYSDGVIYDSFGTSARKDSTDPAQDLTVWHLYEVVSVAGEWTSRLNGVQHFTTGTNTVSFSNNCGIGCGLVSAANYWAQMELARLLIYSAKLTDGNRTSLRAQVSSIYGLGI